jgi:UDP-glucose 4-epimerase
MSESGAVLVTGAAGYLGSHAVAALTRQGRAVVGVDDYRSSRRGVVHALAELCETRPTIIEADLTNERAAFEVFSSFRIGAVIHFAGLKSVAESMTDPHLYYRNNIGATVSLLAAMDAAGVRDLVFSSSCTVYGDAARVPIDETEPVAPISPYGASKAAIEAMLTGMCASDDRWRVLSLRYFNPIGADPSGLIGEDPSVAPTTVMPHIMRALLDDEPLRVFGDDYATPDGTCVRDYIHVSDLIDAHLLALDHLPAVKGFDALNLGTGRGVSVLELVRACSEAAGRSVPYTIVDRRPGDAAVVFANPSYAQERLGWRAVRSLTEACADHFRWQSAHPRGHQQPARQV